MAAMTVPPYPDRYPYPVLPPVREKEQRWPLWRSVDLVVTLVLFSLYAVGLLSLLYLSMFWTMATDSCSTGACDYAKLGQAYFLNDLAGIGVFAVTVVVAIVLLCLRKPAFWLPILGGAIQVVLLLASLDLLAGITPN